MEDSHSNGDSITKLCNVVNSFFCFCLFCISVDESHSAGQILDLCTFAVK